MISATGYRRPRVRTSGGRPQAPTPPAGAPRPRLGGGAAAVGGLRHRLPAARDGTVRGVLDGPARLGELVAQAVRGDPVLLPPGPLPAGGQRQGLARRLRPGPAARPPSLPRRASPLLAARVRTSSPGSSGYRMRTPLTSVASSRARSNPKTVMTSSTAPTRDANSAAASGRPEISRAARFAASKSV